MIKKKEDFNRGQLVMDLTGPQGNAFVLLGTANNLARQLDWDSQEREDLLENMMSGEYEYLVKIFDENFGEFVTLLR